MAPTSARGTRTPTGNGLTIGEVGRILGRLEDAIGGLTDKIESLNFVRADVWEAQKAALLAEHTSIRADVESLRSNIRALVYMLLTAVAGAVAYAVATALVK